MEVDLSQLLAKEKGSLSIVALVPQGYPQKRPQALESFEGLKTPGTSGETTRFRAEILAKRPETRGFSRPELRATDASGCLDAALVSQLEACAAASVHGAFAPSGPAVFFAIEQALKGREEPIKLKA